MKLGSPFLTKRRQASIVAFLLCLLVIQSGLYFYKDSNVTLDTVSPIAGLRGHEIPGLILTPNLKVDVSQLDSWSNGDASTIQLNQATSAKYSPLTFPPPEQVVAQVSGRWFILMAGFTSCGDICPTQVLTLSRALAKINLNLNSNKHEVRGLFYTLDPRRDTDFVLREYLTYFSPYILPLWPVNDMGAQAFESSLGMEVARRATSESLQIAHDGALYFINAEFELNAVLRPVRKELGSTMPSVDDIIDTIALLTLNSSVAN